MAGLCYRCGRDTWPYEAWPGPWPPADYGPPPNRGRPNFGEPYRGGILTEPDGVDFGWDPRDWTNYGKATGGLFTPLRVSF